MPDKITTDNVHNAVSNRPAVIEISASELPLHCPRDDSQLWSSHPRVFIPIEATGTAACAYCGTIYNLLD